MGSVLVLIYIAMNCCTRGHGASAGAVSPDAHTGAGECAHRVVRPDAGPRGRKVTHPGGNGFSVLRIYDFGADSASPVRRQSEDADRLGAKHSGVLSRDHLFSNPLTTAHV